MKFRRLTPEILDDLPQDAPRAKRSRRDLKWINILMGNYRWIGYRMRESPHEQWVELGSGDGPLAASVDREGAPVTGIDFQPRPESWPAPWGWKQGDLFAVLPDVVDKAKNTGLIANLFLHHLETPDLQRLGRLIDQRFDQIIVSEPARSNFFRFISHALFPFINDVTRHDMIVSIEAGFSGDELAEALDLGSDWQISHSTSLLGAYRFEAWKTPATDRSES